MDKQEILDEINKTKEHLANMEKMLEECEYERWKPKKNEFYFYITATGTIEKVKNTISIFDKQAINFYNCFQTEEEAKQEAEKILVRRILENIARRLNKGEKINWEKDTPPQILPLYR